jgi:hypothetical protein
MARALVLPEKKALTLLEVNDQMVASMKEAQDRLLAAIALTESSRQLLHEAGEECWVDKLDHENGKGDGD